MKCLVHVAPGSNFADDSAADISVRIRIHEYRIWTQRQPKSDDKPVKVVKMSVRSDKERSYYILRLVIALPIMTTM